MVIADQQVLDSRAQSSEGGARAKSATRRFDMFDPAVLGTLLIGLNAERAKALPDQRRRMRAAPRRETIGARVALAHGLRRIAAALDKPAVREVAS
jgi:hypothetical protein